MNQQLQTYREQINANEEYTISIVKLNPFTIEDTKVKLSMSVNAVGILSLSLEYLINAVGPIVVAHVINQEQNNTKPMPYRQETPLKFSVNINTDDKVIGFVELVNNDTGRPNNPFGSPFGYNNNQPLNILTIGDLVNYLLTNRHQNNQNRRF